jgi:hypothetical protein
MPKKRKCIVKNNCTKKPYRKQNIPKAIREQCWIQSFGKTSFEHKCYVSWCENIINPFDFHVGHDKPESKGGTLDVDNIKPICARCNLSMSDNYTISEWNELSDKNVSNKQTKKCINCFSFQ